MPWWKTRLYTEGLIEEFTPRTAEVETVEPETVGIRWAQG